MIFFRYSLAQTPTDTIHVKECYPENLTNFHLINLTELKQLNEMLILDIVTKNYFNYLDSLTREKLKCIGLYRFKMSLFRKDVGCILNIPSDENRISFEMKILLQAAMPGDIFQFDYVECVLSNYERVKRSGVFFKVVN